MPIQAVSTALRALLTFFSSFVLGPITVAVFAAFISLLTHLRKKDSLSPAIPEEHHDVSDYYGPGAYYGWLLTAVAAICQSNPQSHVNGAANIDPTVSQTISKMSLALKVYEFASTAAAATYPGVAACDELKRVFARDFGPKFAAADRTAQVGWIFATFYLVHHIVRFLAFPRPNALGQTKRTMPSPATAIWTLLWVLITVAMSAANIVREYLRPTALKVFVPFCVCIPLPIVVMAVGIWWSGKIVKEGWQITVLNIGTLVLSTMYMICPERWKYDSGSSMAPESGSKIANMDQAVGLGVVGALPPLTLRGWQLLRKWLS